MLIQALVWRSLQFAGDYIAAFDGTGGVGVIDGRDGAEPQHVAGQLLVVLRLRHGTDNGAHS
ncbi:hypothetical protein GCM10011494_33100 [Novosphingobium endophyticum]|uniref:Uncharacterized protein n=1 Tax=Novosphingobium endophyticum TaxID=1955250 RepID=A0A916X5X3_9SPHN|nr:hypothetical protein [Novosphingobium endophyticum]GGC11682.1 hypothetical protein GCM10011494_33100 [Novosphingobium endophyticum]